MKGLLANFSWSDLPKIVAAVTSAGCIHVFAIGYHFGPGASAILDATYFSTLLFEASVDFSIAAMIVYGTEIIHFFIGISISKIGFSLGRNREIEVPRYFRPITSAASVFSMLFWFYWLYVGAPPFYLIGLLLAGWILGTIPFRRLVFSLVLWKDNKRKTPTPIRDDVFSSSVEEHVKRIAGLLLTFCILFFPLYIGKQKVDVILKNPPNAKLSISGKEKDIFVIGRTRDFFLYTTLESGLKAVPFSELSYLEFGRDTKEEAESELQ